MFIAARGNPRQDTQLPREYSFWPKGLIEARRNPVEIVAHGESMCRITGCDDVNRVLRAVQPFYRLSGSGVQAFDNGRLLSEEFPAPPKFTSYLNRCLATSGGRNLFQQSLDDEWVVSLRPVVQRGAAELY